MFLDEEDLSVAVASLLSLKGIAIVTQKRSGVVDFFRLIKRSEQIE